MLTTRTNFHHSKLPKLGSIVTVQLYKHLGAQHTPLPYTIAGPQPWKGGWPRFRRFRVEAYPLNDNHKPDGGPVYSVGIHTVHLVALDNGQRVRVAGSLCVED